jgi:DNA-binding NtrC family response regulator
MKPSREREAAKPAATAERRSILIIGCDRGLRVSLASFERRGFQLTMAASGAEGVAAFKHAGADLVMLSLPIADAGAAEVLARLRALDPRVVVVATGRDGDVAGPPDAVRLGIDELIDEVADNLPKALSAIGVLVGARKEDEELRYMRKKAGAGAAGWEAFVGQSPAMQRVFATVQQLCRRTSAGQTPTILLTGETGTGKGLLARCIHYNSVRRNHPFVEVNCAAIPQTLIESELLGNERGAFTDARSSRTGLFETADGGTIFLDEIGSLPLDMQAKLLTVVEEKTVRRLGGHKAARIDVQVVSATHETLSAMVAGGSFRADLYHRLNVVSVEMPALRQRGRDAVLLAESFIDAFCREYGIPPRRLTDEACRLLTQYPWPGNVRELKNRIERIILLEDGQWVEARQLGIAAPASTVLVEDGEWSFSLPPHGIALDRIEREILRQALERFEWNVSRAARYLSISRQTLIYRMKKHKLTRERLYKASA